VAANLQLNKRIEWRFVAVLSHGGRSSAPHSLMEYYQHDGGTIFRFQLAGDLAGAVAMDLEHAWQTAMSIMRGRQLVLDVSGLTGVDSAGIQLIQRMFESGALVVSSEPSAAPDLLLSLGIPIGYSGHAQRSLSLRSRIFGILEGS